MHEAEIGETNGSLEELDLAPGVGIDVLLESFEEHRKQGWRADIVETA